MSDGFRNSRCAVHGLHSRRSCAEARRRKTTAALRWSSTTKASKHSDGVRQLNLLVLLAKVGQHVELNLKSISEPSTQFLHHMPCAAARALSHVSIAHPHFDREGNLGEKKGLLYSIHSSHRIHSSFHDACQCHHALRCSKGGLASLHRQFFIADRQSGHTSRLLLHPDIFVGATPHSDTACASQRRLLQAWFHLQTAGTSG